MLSILGRTSANVGYVLGDKTKGVIRNIVIFGDKFSAAQTADTAAIETALVAASLKAKSDAGKLYWLPEVQNFEDRAEQNTTGALNLGPTVMLKEGKPGYEIKVDGNSEFAKEMRKWNNKTVGCFEFDSNRQLWGRQVGTDFYGYSAKIFVNSMRVASGQAPEEGIVTVTISFLSATEYGDSSRCLDLSEVDTGLIKTQVDAEFSETAAHVSEVYTMKWLVDLANMGVGYDIADLYETEIDADAGAAFEAFTGATYDTPLTITTISVTNGIMSVTFDSTEFAALGSGAKIKFNAKAPSVLAAAGIHDVEGVAIILTK